VKYSSSLRIEIPAALLTASLILLTLPVGCASPMVKVEVPEIFQASYSGETPGKVVVIRASNVRGWTEEWVLCMDWCPLLTIGIGEYTEVYLPEGEHHIHLRMEEKYPWMWLFIAPTMPVQIQGSTTHIKFVAAADQTTYFLIDPSPTSGVEMRPINKMEANEHIQGSKFISIRRSFEIHW